MIYFITAGNKHVKIGYSANPEKRLKELQTGNPLKLKLVTTIPGSYETEKALHLYFTRNKREGEWFHLTGELGNCLKAAIWPKRKHVEPTTIKQFLENGIHFHLSQKAKRSKKVKNLIRQYSVETK